MRWQLVIGTDFEDSILRLTSSRDVGLVISYLIRWIEYDPLRWQRIADTEQRYAMSNRYMTTSDEYPPPLKLLFTLDWDRRMIVLDAVEEYDELYPDDPFAIEDRT